MSSDVEIARAQALGRAAGRAREPLNSNPYPESRADLRVRWATAYADVAHDHLAGARRIGAGLKRWWRAEDPD